MRERRWGNPAYYFFITLEKLVTGDSESCCISKESRVDSADDPVFEFGNPGTNLSRKGQTEEEGDVK